MLLTFVFIALLTLTLGLCALLINLQNAPEGFEDETGFHVCAPARVNQTNSVAFDDQQTEGIPTLAGIDHGRMAA